MKKLIFAIILFVIYTAIVNSCPLITSWDESFITIVQRWMKGMPIEVALLPDCKLYSAMIIIPIIVTSAMFIKKKVYWKIPFIISVPLVTFLSNIVIKNMIQRPRPELQLAIHPTSFSYVSSHSLITFCLWGFLTYLVCKYFQNKQFKAIFTILAVVWTLFVGFSRIWLGVHNPSDVLGAYFLGGILLYIFVLCYECINTRLKKDEAGSCSL